VTRIIRIIVTLLAAAGLMAGLGWGVAGSTEAHAQVTELQSAKATEAKAPLKGIDKRCKTKGRVLCINKRTDKLHYLVDSKIVKTMDARFGCAKTRTREGTFSVRRKSRKHVSSIYHTPMPYAMFFSGGQAVHYSADFAKRGYHGCSHGCVNLRDRAGIAWLFGKIRVGDRVVVYKS
jgi:lipoprotein-anchoring transpeptidase ErfK/SrfK